MVCRRMFFLLVFFFASAANARELQELPVVLQRREHVSARAAMLTQLVAPVLRSHGSRASIPSADAAVAQLAGVLPMANSSMQFAGLNATDSANFGRLAFAVHNSTTMDFPGALNHTEAAQAAQAAATALPQELADAAASAVDGLFEPENAAHTSREAHGSVVANSSWFAEAVTGTAAFELMANSPGATVTSTPITSIPSDESPAPFLSLGPLWTSTASLATLRSTTLAASALDSQDSTGDQELRVPHTASKNRTFMGMLQDLEPERFQEAGDPLWAWLVINGLAGVAAAVLIFMVVVLVRNMLQSSRRQQLREIRVPLQDFGSENTEALHQDIDSSATFLSSSFRTLELSGPCGSGDGYSSMGGAPG